MLKIKIFIPFFLYLCQSKHKHKKKQNPKLRSSEGGIYYTTFDTFFIALFMLLLANSHHLSKLRSFNFPVGRDINSPPTPLFFWGRCISVHLYNDIIPTLPMPLPQSRSACHLATTYWSTYKCWPGWNATELTSLRCPNQGRVMAPGEATLGITQHATSQIPVDQKRCSALSPNPSAWSSFPSPLHCLSPSRCFLGSLIK